jgi:hypothetical protein
MRIGNRLCGALAWSIVIAAFALNATAAEPERVRPVPLGGSLAEQTGDHYFGVYIPTRFGGLLTVNTSDGTVAGIIGPDGHPRQNGQEVGPNSQGWFSFQVTGTKDNAPYTVETKFVQIGESARKVWNFYYWPTKADSLHEPWAEGNGRVDTMSPAGDDVQVVPYGSPIAPGRDIILAGPNGLLETKPAQGDTSTWFPNLYDDLTAYGADGTEYQTPSPLLKYDQIFNVSARNWEAANSQNQDISRWPGHCLGGAMASIMLNEPRPVPGSGMTQDELKALWAELGENHLNHKIGDNVSDIPPGPPRRGYDETDQFAPKFHRMLETHLRGKRQALLGNLRAFPPTGKPNEVWNHGIGKYVSTFHAIPGEGARRVRIETELFANSGSNLNEGDPKPRTNTYEYIILYGANGEVDERAVALSDWISVGNEAMFAPLNLMEVTESHWQGHNPLINETNVRSLDLANGGGSGNGGINRRLAGAAPEFRPVGKYEAGRGPLLSNARGESPQTPRRGFFRIFGRN